MDSQHMHVVTLANSIIGVGILAMPYCFKQCGILLSIVFLLLSSIISRLACHFLLKSAIKARLRTFEFLAFHAFGSVGKLIIEIGMIGFLIGTCIAFFVVMGDLGPQIANEMIGVHITSTLRTSILLCLAIFCILPLGLLRNVDSLSGVCAATIAFYGCLVLKIMADSLPHIISGDWYEKVVFWRPAGVLQCIPIFSMALFCQTQLFEIYQAIPNASLEKMNSVIRSAVNICTCVYIFVGTFGYIAVAHLPFTGNILISLTPSMVTSTMKIGFVLSVAFSFPLVIFPCRASLHSLLYKNAYTQHEGNTNYIPERKFRGLTFVIVLVSLITGVLIPNIELVLGLVGSTIGVMICVIFPATCFICLSQKNTNERIVAQIMLCIGIVVMVLGTYANLYAFEGAHSQPITEKLAVSVSQINNVKLNDINSKVDDAKSGAVIIPEIIQKAPDITDQKIANTIQNVGVENVVKEIRHEPPQPEAPVDDPSEEKENEQPKLGEASANLKENVPVNQESIKEEAKVKTIQSSILEAKIISDNIKVANENLQLEANAKKPDSDAELTNTKLDNVAKEVSVENNLVPIKTVASKEKSNKKVDEVDIEAIKKEEKEIEQQLEQKVVKPAAVEKETAPAPLEKDAIKSLEKEKAVKAIQEIEEIAKKAIGDIVRNITSDNAKKDPKKEEGSVMDEKKDNSQNMKIIKEVERKVAEVKLADDPKKVNYDFQNLVPIPVVKSNNLQSIYANNKSALNVSNSVISKVDEQKIQPQNKAEEKLDNIQVSNKVDAVKMSNNVDENLNVIQSINSNINIGNDKQVNKDENKLKDNLPVAAEIQLSNTEVKDANVKADKTKATLPPINLMQVLKGSNIPIAANKDTIKENIVVNKEPPVDKKIEDAKKEAQEDIKSLRRDILETHDRAKRESVLLNELVVNDEHCDKTILSPDRK